MKAFVSVICLCVLLFACTGNNKAPGLVVDEFLAAMKQRDYAKAKELTTKESASLIDAVASSSQNLFPVQAGDSCKITSLSMKNDSCFVTVMVEHHPYPMKLLVLKKSGSWKVAYDLQTMFNLNE